MSQSQATGWVRLPIELQLSVIEYLVQDLHLGPSATRQDWLTLHDYTTVNHAWFDELVILLSRSVPITDIVQHALSTNLIDAILEHYICQVDGATTTSTRGQDLRYCAYICIRRHLAQSLKRVLTARSLPLDGKDQKRMMSIALREHDFVCADVLVSRSISPYNLPILLAIRRKRLDLLIWMVHRGAPVRKLPFSLLKCAMKTCTRDDEAGSSSKTGSIIQLLLDHGAEIDPPALTLLKQRPQFEKLLLAREPRGDPQVCLERMVVHYHQYDHIIDRCLDRGANPNVDVDGWPLLARAIQRRSLAVCEQLLKHGAASEPECERTRSPMYHAVRRIGPTYHRLLTRYGANPRRNYRPRQRWEDYMFDAYKEEREYYASPARRWDGRREVSSNPPRVIHQPTAEKNLAEQLRWTAVADALAYPRKHPDS